MIQFDVPLFLFPFTYLKNELGLRNVRLQLLIFLFIWRFFIYELLFTVSPDDGSKLPFFLGLNFNPKHINLEAVKNDLSAIKGVMGIHDIHIWSLDGETDVFTAHTILDDETLKKQPEQTKQTIKETLQKHHIEHSTIEIESKYHCTGNICEEWQKKHQQ